MAAVAISRVSAHGNFMSWWSAPLTCLSALLRAGLTLADVGSDTAMVQLLLGSMPIITAAAALRENTAVHRDVLRASSKYIKCVYDARWTYGHMLNK